MGIKKNINTMSNYCTKSISPSNFEGGGLLWGVRVRLSRLLILLLFLILVKDLVFDNIG